MATVHTTMAINSELQAEEVFELLSNPRRRFIIAYLRETADPVDIKHLAREIASLENGVPIDDLTDSQEKRVHVSLYQTHVPKLSEAGVLEYEQERGLVTRSDGIRDVERYVPGAKGSALPWEALYASVAVAGLALHLVAAVDLGLFPSLTTSTTSLVVVVSFVVLVVVQFLVTRLQKGPSPFDYANWTFGEES